MAKFRYIVRGALLTFIVLIPVYLRIKSEDTLKCAAEFNYEALKSLQGNYLARESDKFSNQVIGDVYKIRDGVQYLLIFIVMFLVTEVIWIFVRKLSRN